VLGSVGVSKVKLLVAVVDDEPAVCKAVERLLRSSGIDVVTFTCGTAFLSSLSLRKPDCVVLDINMLRMNGFDVLSQLASNPATSDISVVTMTGAFSAEMEHRMKTDQSITRLNKPFEQQALLNAIWSAVASKSG
jgi:FixJ family two-component response regulator